jgi:arylformamidase
LTWFDLTRRLDDELICWPGRQAPILHWRKRLEEGQHCNESIWSLSAHTGTHIEAPKHFLTGGRSIDQVSVDTLTGPCELVDISMRSSQTLTAEEAEALRGRIRLLIKTGFGEEGHFSDHPALLAPEAANLLVESGLALIGTDRLSVDDSTMPDFTLHCLLLSAGCVIVEGLDLSQVAEGSYELCALPIPFVGAEASPARVLIRSSCDHM